MGDFSDTPHILNSIFERRIDGLIIKQALPSRLVDTLIDLVESKKTELEPNHHMQGGHGFTYPVAFSRMAPMGDREKQEYFENNPRDRASLNRAVSFDIEKTIVDVFSSIGCDYSFKIPPGPQNRGTYLGYTFRNVNAGGGEIPLHCGNWLQTQFGGFYTHLSSICSVKNQLSYFFLLQPSNGGELVLYDIEWEDGQDVSEDPPGVRTPSSNVIPTSVNSKTRRMALNLEKGDMLCFAGGEIWHDVTAVEEPDSRITMGGFMGLETGTDNIFYWS